MIACSRQCTSIFAAEWPRRVLLGVSALALILCLDAGASLAGETAPDHDKFHGWWELGAYYGSDDSSRGEVTIFQPLGQTASSLFFADLRGKFFEEDTQEGNIAVGYRRMLTSGWNLGIWSGLDVRSTDTDNKFWQASGGIEALSERWDFRANGYVPLTGPKTSPSLAEVSLTGNSIFMIGGEEVPLYGVDGEIGFKVFGGHRGGGSKDGISYGRHTELRIYGGGFWFDADDALEEIAGPRARIEFRIEDIIASMPGSRLTFEGEFSHDDVRNDKWEFGARLRIPFGGSRDSHTDLSSQQRRMTEGLERDTDIVTAASEAEPVEDAQTKLDFDRVAYVDAGGSLTTTSTNAGDKSLIVVRGDPVAGQQTLQGNQTFLGTGSVLQVRGLKTGSVANLLIQGSRPVINQPANALIVRLLASNVHLAGLNLEGGGGALTSNSGISFNNFLTNVLIENMQISNTGGRGIVVGGSNEFSILNVSINSANTEGILIQQNNTVSIVGTTIDGGAGVTDDGIFISNGNTITMKNSRLVGTFSDDGIDENTGGNTLSGAGNIAGGAVFGGQFCESTGGPTGTFSFDIGTCP